MWSLQQAPPIVGILGREGGRVRHGKVKEETIGHDQEDKWRAWGAYGLKTYTGIITKKANMPVLTNRSKIDMSSCNQSKSYHCVMTDPPQNHQIKGSEGTHIFRWRGEVKI